MPGKITLELVESGKLECIRTAAPELQRQYYAQIATAVLAQLLRESGLVDARRDEVDERMIKDLRERFGIATHTGGEVEL